MAQLIKARTEDYPYPVIFFKKDLEKIRSASASKQESRFLISVYFAFREISSDIDEGLVTEPSTKEKFIELLEEYSGKNIWSLDYLLKRFSDLDVDTGIKVKGGSYV